MNNLSIVIISGLSGAGKSNAARVLEDMGYNTIDNVPPQVAEKIVEIFYGLDKRGTKLAFVIDSRAGDGALIYNAIKMLKDKYGAALLFMEASEDTLVNRYKETRRKHPQGGDLVEAIKAETRFMDDVKDLADIIFDSDGKNVRELAEEIQAYFSDFDQGTPSVTVESFGFKYGVPAEADLVFDVRFLRNPYFDAGLKNLTGIIPEVRDYVEADPNYGKFMEKLTDFLTMLVPLYAEEGKKYLTIAVGCTGGRHRSVTVAERLASVLQCQVKHRDIEK